ncbi:MAG TPA: four helix bundle protein [Tepidisphaeraceae bacterium]|nr:four helix bundle protein [Tepidisphaeraceae bacterium]
MRSRTKRFAMEIIRLYGQMPKTAEGQVLGHQFLQSGTSVGAQYREAHRARSAAEFISKMEGSLQELDETDYWLDLVIEARILSASIISPLQREVQELIAIFVSSVRTAKASRSRSP